MKKSLALSAILGASLLALSLSALAQSVTKSSAVNGNSGVYVGGDVGVGEENYIGDPNGGAASGINVGYQFNPHVAAEAGHSFYPSQDGVRYTSTYAAIKGMLPFSSGIVLFAKAGPVLVGAHANIFGVNLTGREATLYGALGVGYNFTPAVQANIQIDGTMKRGHDENDDNYVPAMYRTTVGMSYLFNT
jgi:hypothetical protein